MLNDPESSNAYLSAEDPRENHRQKFFSRPDSQGTHSNPVPYDSQFEIDGQEKLVARPQQRESTGSFSAEAGGTASDEIILQLETPPVTKEQMINEIETIYAKLNIEEEKCIEIHMQPSKSQNISSPQTPMTLHLTLLEKHYDLWRASQHLSSTANVKYFSEQQEHGMIDRIWCHGIYSFLELLRHQLLPDSLEIMRTFIHLAYSMITLLLEDVPAFEDAWIEYLGNLARYRMGVEASNPHDHAVWARVARYWYNKAADKYPDIGRIQYHFAILARPDIVQQLFYYTKSLVSVHSSANTRDSIPSLFNPLLNPNQYPIITAFMAAHGYLFLRTSTSTDQFITSANKFLSALGRHISQTDAAFKMQGVYMTSCNFAAILDYGQADAIITAYQPISHNDPNTAEERTPHSNMQAVEADLLAFKSTQFMFYGSYLTAQTLTVILDQFDILDQFKIENIYPAVHISLAFFWCSAPNFTMRHVRAMAPWRKIVNLLNKMIYDAPDPRIFERTEFPFTQETKQIPEDFLIRGQIWSQRYYPLHFFENCLEEDARFIEFPWVTNILRVYRCLWLGVRIATVRGIQSSRGMEGYANKMQFNCWIKYNFTLRKFSITPFASELEKLAQRHNPFWKDAATAPFGLWNA